MTGFCAMIRLILPPANCCTSACVGSVYIRSIFLFLLIHRVASIAAVENPICAALKQTTSFVKDANQVKNKGSLFMWKLGQLKKAKKTKTRVINNK